MRRICDFIRDDSGAAGTELAFVASVLVLGSVVGLLVMRAELLGQSRDLRSAFDGSSHATSQQR